MTERLETREAEHNFGQTKSTRGRGPWRELVKALSPGDLHETRATFGAENRNLRGFLFHMGQHVIYKAGQIWLLAFELGVDGGDPYTAPHPNEDYGFGNPGWPSPRK